MLSNLLWILLLVQDQIKLVGKSWDRNWFCFHKNVSLEWYLVSNVLVFIWQSQWVISNSTEMSWLNAGRSVKQWSVFVSLSLDTSRPKRPEEVNERDYYFVPLPTFEADIVANKFVEHGEFEGHYYGTALDSIRRVTNSGKHCILNLHCEVWHYQHVVISLQRVKR